MKLMDNWLALEPEAREVLLMISDRLVAGQREYGIMHVLDDERDFFCEAAEEAADFLVYWAMHELRKQKGAAV